MFSLAPLLPHRPVGVFEFDKFAGGSKAVLEAIVAATEKGATSIIGELGLVWFTRCAHVLP